MNFYQLNVTDAIAFQFMLQFIIKGKDCRLQIKKKNRNISDLFSNKNASLEGNKLVRVFWLKNELFQSWRYDLQ